MVLRRIKELLKRGASRSPGAVQAAVAEAAVTPPVTPHPHPPPPVHRGPELVHHPVALRDLDQDAVRIIKRLTRFDHTAYLVGGCVRDLLLDRQPKDFDIGTSATPRQIKRLFSNCRIIGRRFRLAHIYFQNGKIIEVATFRARDGGDPVEEPVSAAAAGLDDGDDLLIRDDNVFGTQEEDALRRDFTINALFYDVNAETVLDHAEGLSDLRRRSVRTIGDPATRFREDPIRILRAIKFAARLDFEIEPKTLAALRQTRSEIPKAAPPRVLEELNRFCRGAAARRSFELMLDTGVFEVVLPELHAHYGTEGPERSALLALLGAIDARVAGGLDVSAGEIFAALLVAPIAPKFGWALSALPASGGHADARTVVDDVLRPIALRLRVARKDQERARQALATLQRLVPVRPMRRGLRTALQRRPAFADAWWMLEALAPVLGGDFAAARADWAEHLARPGADVAPAAEPAGAEGEADRPERTGRRRRGRRGGRGRRGEAPVVAVAEAPAQAPARAAAPAAPAKKLPAVWSDDYFFAALPSVPDLVVEEQDTDRYGAARVAPAEVTAPSSAQPASPARRRSRRGGRRHRKRSPIIPSDGASTPSEGES